MIDWWLTEESVLPDSLDSGLKDYDFTALYRIRNLHDNVIDVFYEMRSSF